MLVRVEVHAHPLSLYLYTITSKVVVYAPAERACRARKRKHLGSPGRDFIDSIDSMESIPPGWESIPGFLKRFTNTGSDTLPQFLFYPTLWHRLPFHRLPPHIRGCCCRVLIGRNCHMINDLGSCLRILPYNCRSSRCRWDFRNEIQ